jgi:hypothetical protein
MDFLQSQNIDAVIKEIIEIFSDIEGVELVRLNGLTNHINNISNIPKEEIEIIIKKLKFHNIIQFKFELICPHCNEHSYIIKHDEDFILKPKLCDTCNTFYSLIKNSTLI